ncbi:helix-turn-helix domain-containing protein [Sphingobacterium siyangense]|uniref:helix-turn-helix domain-containing protein n=1 Tax=Sphingobacterium siyangense TaxID=459529 RepID=UPI003C74374A
MRKNLTQIRNEKRFSQQELANLSGISIRTIQRIEKNESKGSPYVIKKLCATLEADPQTICFEPGDPDEKEADQLQKVPATESTDNASIRRDASRAIKYINFSSLTVLLLPFSNLISTAVFFFIFKKKLNHAINRVTALKILSFQIIWSIATILLMIAVPLFIFLFPTIPASMLDIPTFIWVYWFMLSFQLITTLVISFHLNKTDNPIQFIPNIL